MSVFYPIPFLKKGKKRFGQNQTVIKLVKQCVFTLVLACCFPYFLAAGSGENSGQFDQEYIANLSYFLENEKAIHQPIIQLHWAILKKAARVEASSSMMGITLTAPADRTVDCAPPPVQMPAASTTCATDPEVQLTLREVTTNIKCEHDFTLLRIWIATDACMNMARDTQFITVKDDRAPSLFLTHPLLQGLSDGDTVQFQCDQLLSFDETDAISGDNCDANPSIRFIDYVQDIGDCREDGYLRKMVCGWVAEDKCGNTTSITLIMLVVDTAAPVFLQAPDTIDVDCHRLGSVTIAAEDNCTEDVIITHKDWVMPGDCIGEAMIIRTWHAYDNCGNHSSRVQVINLRDTTPPDLIGVPDDLFLHCQDSVPPPPMVTATDRCDSTIVLNFEESDNGDFCERRIVRIWSAEDDCGNMAVDSQVIMIADTVPPIVVDAPLDTVLNCGVRIPNDVPRFFDECTDSVTVVATSTVIPDSCGYRIERVWNATDLCGNTLTLTQNITIIDTTGPVFSVVPPDRTVSCDSIPDPAVLGDGLAVIDNCDSLLTIAFAESLTKEDSCVTWEIIRTWTATDDCGNTTTASQVLSIVDLDGPVLTGIPGDTLIECDDPIPPVSAPTATDNCDPDPVISFEEDRTDGPCDGTFTILRSWTAFDECGNSTTGTQRITAIDTTAPTITFVNPILTDLMSGDTLRFECDSVVLLDENDVLAEDNCSDPDVSFTVARESSDDCVRDGYIEKLLCTWTATDDCGNSSTLFIIVLIVDTTPPILLNIPADTLLTCDQSLPNSGTITALDNCNTPVALSSRDSLIPGNCFGNFELVRTWIAVDFCGNQATASQRITVTDSLAPVFNSHPDDTTVACDAVPPFAVVTANDNCALQATIDTNEYIVPGNCPGNFLIRRVWIAADDCGNTDSITQLITVIDTLPPVFDTVPSSLYAECQDSIPVAMNISATDNCDDNVEIDFEEERIDGNCANNFEIIRIWTATDFCGNSSSISQVISFTDTVAPVVVYLPENQVIPCDSSFTQNDDPVFEDNCDDSLSISFNQTIIDGNCATNFIIENSWTALDDCGNSITVVQQITVEDDTPPVFVEVPADTTITCNQPLPVQEPIVEDLCDFDITVTVATDSVPGNCPQEWTITRTWTASDDCGNTSTASQVISVIDTVTPVITFIHPDFSPANSGDTIFMDCDNLVLLNENDVEVNDNCSSVTLTFHEEVVSSGDCVTDGYFQQLICTWTAEDLCGNTDSFYLVVYVQDATPPNFIFVPADTTISCNDSLPSLGDVIVEDNCNLGNILVELDETTVPGSCAGFFNITRVWTATDICGNTATASQVVSLSDTSAPVFTYVPADTTLSCDVFDSYSDDAVAEDVCDPDIVVTLQESTIDGSCENEFTLQRTWIATDACGNESVARQIIMVIDTTGPEFLAFFPDTLVSCENLFAPDTPSVADNCSSGINLLLLEFEIPGNCPNEYTLTRRWLASDDCGNITSRERVIRVLDQTAPVLSNVPADITLSCRDTLPPPATLSVSDNCGSAVNIQIDEIRTDGNCPYNYTISRIWTASDACGNISTAEQVFTFIDTIAPQIFDIPNDTTLSCDALIPMAMPGTFSDNCDDAPVISMEEEMLGSTCVDFRLERTWTITDICGNSNAYTQTIFLIDDEAPVFSNIPRDTLLSCDQVPPLVHPEVADNCDPNPEVDFVETIVPGNCSNNYDIIRSWTAADICGNEASITQQITIIDTLAPTVSLSLPGFGNVTSGDTLVIECDQLVPVDSTSAVVTDNCDPNPDVDFIELIDVSDDCVADGYLTFMDCRWIATDDCGNRDSLIVYIRIIDTTAPVITLDLPGFGSFTSGDTLEIECDQLVPIDSSSADITDNCAANPDFEFLEVIDVSTDCATDGYLTFMDCRWIATDDCGNESTFIIFVKIVDTTAPEITGVGSDTIIYAALDQNVPPVPNAAVSDNCDGMPSLVYRDGLKTDSCGYAIIRTWEAEDHCGNQGFEEQIVRVEASFTVDTISIKDASCGFNDGSADFRVLGDEANYVFTWTPDQGTPSPNNNARTDLPPGTYTINIHLQDFEFCNQTLEFTIGDGCEPLVRDTIYVDMLEPTKEVCLDATILEDPTPLISTAICNAGLQSAVAVTNIDQSCLTLVAGNGFSGTAPEAMCVVHCFESGYCDTTIIIATVDPLAFNPCANDEVNLMISDQNFQTANCPETQGLCLDIPTSIIADFDVFLNGKKWVADFEECREISAYAYHLNTLFPLQTGVYRLEITMQNGQQFMGDFTTISGLLQLMNGWNPTGNWTYEPIYGILSGVPNAQIPGDMVVHLPSNQGSTEIALQEVLSVALPITTGSNAIKAKNIITGCEKEAKVDLYCITPEDMHAYLMVDETKKACLDLAELPGLVTNVENIRLTNNPEVCATTEIVDGTCVSMTGLNVGREKICLIVHDDKGLVDTTFLYIEVGNERPPLTVNNGISPNGDGQNDFFTIDNIEYYPESKLSIFNRWGNLVFEKSGYQNDWSGQYQSNDLPDGVYFYVLELDNGEVINGYISLQR